MFPADELARARADMLDTLPGTAIVQRETVTVDDYGHGSAAWAAVGTSVCRLDPYTRQDSAGMVAQREANRSYYALTLPYDATIDDGDRVSIGGVTYEVLQLHAAQSWALTKRATVGKAAG